MKILHVITGLGNGGAEAVLLRLVGADRIKGNEHCVVSLTDRGVYGERMEQMGVSVYTLDCPRGRITLSSLFALLKIMRDSKPDVVQTWMYHADLIGGLVARLSGIRSISWGIRHANLDPAHNSSGTLLVVRVCAYLSRWIPRKIITCSEQAMHLHRAVGYQAEKFVQIPNGYSLDRLKPELAARDNIRLALGVKPDIFVFGMVARFDAQKDHQNLIKALGLLKSQGMKFTCLLVGSGMAHDNVALRDLIDRAGIFHDVLLLGPRSDIPAIMNALDVHVLSSLGEAFPNVLAEAMACGTPCVTTDVGDAALIVAQHGWVVVPQDAEALAEGLTKAQASFLRNGEEWQNLKIACRSHIMANFELERMCERYRQVWKTCVQDT